MGRGGHVATRCYQPPVHLTSALYRTTSAMDDHNSYKGSLGSNMNDFSS
jgi:hypothetical protein